MTPSRNGASAQKTNLLVENIELAVGDLRRLLDVRVVEEVLLDLLRLGRHLSHESCQRVCRGRQGRVISRGRTVLA